MSFTQSQPGVFVVSVLTADDLLPGNQDALVAALGAALKEGKAGLVFEVAPVVRIVDVSVPTFWLGVTSRLTIAAIAIVTSTTLVRVAARGFGVANKLRGLSTQVQVFPSTDEATPWVRSLL